MVESARPVITLLPEFDPASLGHVNGTLFQAASVVRLTKRLFRA
jgi:hypothetical protein